MPLQAYPICTETFVELCSVRLQLFMNFWDSSSQRVALLLMRPSITTWWRPLTGELCLKKKHKHTWMKNSLGFPTKDLQRSPRKSDVRHLSSMGPSVPNNTPSSPWLSRMQTKEAQQLWSCFAAEKISNTSHDRVTARRLRLGFGFWLTSHQKLSDLLHCLVVVHLHFVAQIWERLHCVGCV